MDQNKGFDWKGVNVERKLPNSEVFTWETLIVQLTDRKDLLVLCFYASVFESFSGLLKVNKRSLRMTTADTTFSATTKTRLLVRPA